jgi:hypothetical protein
MCQATFCTTNHQTIQFAVIYAFIVEWRPDWIWICLCSGRKILPEKYWAARSIGVQHAQPGRLPKAASSHDSIASTLATMYSQFC